jgi:REP element-mobilizing transposase RayT
MTRREPIRAEPGSWHHLTLFTLDRTPIFKNAALATTMQSVLNAARERHGLRVVAYCIMPHHFHWLVQVTEFSLELFALDLSRKGSRMAEDPPEHFVSRMMADIRAQSTAALRRTNSNLPHDLWMTTFWHRLIRTPMDMAAAIDAIHGYPVQAQIAATPADYPYSSGAHILDGKPSLMQIDRIPRRMTLHRH